MIARPSHPRGARAPGCAAAHAAGFTLLEMLVVMALIGVLMGMGVGFLRRTGDDFEIALAAIRAATRAAQLTARTRHLPAEVVLDPGQDGPASVRARILEPVGHWHMEEDPRDDESAGVPSEVRGTVEPGRFGMARRSEESSRSALLTVRAGTLPVFDLRDGFAIRVDLKLEAAEEAVIARLGEGFVDLRLDADLRPVAKIVGTEGGGRSAGSVTLAGTRALSLHAWHTLELVHDRSHLRLLLDGREIGRETARLPVLQSASDVLEVSPADGPVQGLVDEVLVLAYTLSPPQRMPVGLQLAADPSVVRFDAEGDLDGPCAFRLTVEDDTRSYRFGPGGVIE
ncbi:MAG: prepilin-type N-terminal cleavage/methylation domain-containing protein [Planctomycetota bacterium]